MTIAKNNKFVFCLLMCLYMVSAEWSDPEPMFEVNNNANFYDAYTDADADKGHILFSIGNKPELFYCSVNDGKIVHMAQFGLIGGSAFITGDYDGDNIFVAFTNKDHKIEFTESDNSGDSWKPTQKITGRDDCIIGALNYVQETGRLYTVLKCGNDIVFAARPSGSSIFSFERVIATETKPFEYVSSAFTLKQKIPVVHVVWSTADNIKYIFSEDNGANWSPIKNLQAEPSKDHPVAKMHADSHISKAVFIMFKSEKGYALTYSLDSCNSFYDEVIVEEQKDRMPDFALYGSPEKNMLITTGSKYKLYSGFENGSMKFKEYTTPFNMNLPSIAMLEGKGSYKILYVGHDKKDSGIIATTEQRFDIY